MRVEKNKNQMSLAGQQAIPKNSSSANTEEVSFWRERMTNHKPLKTRKPKEERSRRASWLSFKYNNTEVFPQTIS